MAGYSQFFKQIVENAQSAPQHTTSPDWLTNAFTKMFAPGPTASPQMTVPTYTPQGQYSQQFTPAVNQVPETAAQTPSRYVDPGRVPLFTTNSGFQQTPEAKGGGQGGSSQASSLGNIPVSPRITPEEQALMDQAVGAIGNQNFSTFTPGDLADGQRSQYQQLLDKALKYWLGYDTSPEAKQIADVQKRIGSLMGAYQQAFSTIETTPGLTGFQAGRRYQALNQASGAVIEPLQAQLEALTGLRQSRETSMQNALEIAQMGQPQFIGSPITDESGNVRLVQYDPTTGGTRTIDLGRIAAPNQKTQVVEANGRQMLIDSATGALIKDLGASRATVSGAGAGVGSDYGMYLVQQIQNRQLDLKTLNKDEKQLALKTFSALGIPLPRPLTTAQLNMQQDAVSGLAAIDKAQSIYNSDNGILWKNALPGFAGRIAGASDFRNAVNEAIDIKTRIRTGAALTENEVRFYSEQLPKYGDNPTTANNKFSQLRGFYLGMSGIPVTVISPDGSEYLFDDLYNPQQRLGLREAINNGFSLSY